MEFPVDGFQLPPSWLGQLEARNHFELGTPKARVQQFVRVLPLLQQAGSEAEASSPEAVSAARQPARASEYPRDRWANHGSRWWRSHA
eukprot:12128662-Alexandrium_andersonii.AAC.1